MYTGIRKRGGIPPRVPAGVQNRLSQLSRFLTRAGGHQRIVLILAAALTVALFPVGRARLLFLTPALCAFTAAAIANRPDLNRTRRIEAIIIGRRRRRYQSLCIGCK